MNANEITIDITIGRLNQVKEFEGRAVSLLEASMMANELLARRAQAAKQEGKVEGKHIIKYYRDGREYRMVQDDYVVQQIVYGKATTQNRKWYGLGSDWKEITAAEYEAAKQPAPVAFAIEGVPATAGECAAFIQGAESPVVEPVAGASVKGQCPVCGGWASQCDCTFPTQPAKPRAQYWRHGNTRNGFMTIDGKIVSFMDEGEVVKSSQNGLKLKCTECLKNEITADEWVALQRGEEHAKPLAEVEIEPLPKSWPDLGSASIEMRLKINEIIAAVNRLAKESR